MIIEDESIIVCYVAGMGLTVQSTMTYVVLRCVTNGMCNEWEDTVQIANLVCVLGLSPHASTKLNATARTGCQTEPRQSPHASPINRVFAPLSYGQIGESMASSRYKLNTRIRNKTITFHGGFITVSTGTNAFLVCRKNRRQHRDTFI